MKTTLSASAPADAISLKAYYVGPRISTSKKHWTPIYKRTVLVKAVCSDGSETVVMDWNWIGTNYVRIDRVTKLKIQCGTLTTEVEILFNTDVVSFECHYLDFFWRLPRKEAPKF